MGARVLGDIKNLNLLRSSQVNFRETGFNRFRRGESGERFRGKEKFSREKEENGAGGRA